MLREYIEWKGLVYTNRNLASCTEIHSLHERVCLRLSVVPPSPLCRRLARAVGAVQLEGAHTIERPPLCYGFTSFCAQTAALKLPSMPAARCPPPPTSPLRASPVLARLYLRRMLQNHTE